MLPAEECAILSEAERSIQVPSRKAYRVVIIWPNEGQWRHKGGLVGAAW